MTREILEQIVEEHDYLYILIVNGGILRSKQHAYYAGLSEESIREYYEKIKDQLGDDPEYEINILDLDDFSNYAVLYSTGNYPAFYLVEYGEVPTELLYTKRADVIEKVKDILLSLDSDHIFCPANSEHVGITRVIGKKNITQSFYTTKEKLLDTVPDEEFSIEPIDLIDTLTCAKGWIPQLFTLDDMLISGFEFLHAIFQYFRQIHIFGEEIIELLNRDELYYGYDKNDDAPVKNTDYPIIFTDRDRAEEICNFIMEDPDAFEVRKITKDKETFDFIINEKSDLMIIDEDSEIARYCFSRDLRTILLGYEPKFCIRNQIKLMQDIDSTPVLYTLTSKEKGYKGVPQHLINTKEDSEFLIFTDQEEARKFIKATGLAVDIGIIKNDTEKQFHDLIVSAHLNKHSALYVCFNAPLSEELNEANMRIFVDEWADYLGRYNFRRNNPNDYYQLRLETITV